jgi:hypothetical protein
MSYPREKSLFGGEFAGFIPVCTLAFGANVRIFFFVAWHPDVSASFALVSL